MLCSSTWMLKIIGRNHSMMHGPLLPFSFQVQPILVDLMSIITGMSVTVLANSCGFFVCHILLICTLSCITFGCLRLFYLHVLVSLLLLKCHFLCACWIMWVFFFDSVCMYAFFVGFSMHVCVGLCMFLLDSLCIFFCCLFLLDSLYSHVDGLLYGSISLPLLIPDLCGSA